jgi:4-amino-4-deoxy-L-arabinose transferase-like glycosyltransferase
MNWWKAAWRAEPRTLAWALFALALGVRLVYLAQGYPVPPQDTPDYDEFALNLLRGQGFVARENWFGFELRSWRPPFYPFFLAGVYGTWGYSHAAVQGVQALVGAGTTVLVWALARRLHSRSAVLAGLLAALYGPLVAISSEVMSETWFTFWGALSLWLLLDASGGRGGKWRSLIGGVAIGLAGLTRPVGLLLWPAFALTAFLRLGRRAWGPVLWVGLAAALAVLPWTLRNYRVHGEWVPIATHGGFILARSNAAQPAWRQEHGWGIEESFFRQIPSEVERDRHWYQQGMDFIRAHPGAYLRLVGERFLRLWYFLRPEYNFWFALVLPLALVGFWRYGLQGDFLLVSAYAGLSILVFCTLLYGSTRFRLPLEPFFLIFAAAFVRDAADRWGWRRVGGMAAAWVGLHLLLWGQDEALRALVLDWLDRLHLR